MAHRSSKGRDREVPWLALLVALPEEARGILRAGEWRRAPATASLALYERYAGGARVVLAVSGVGKARAEATARAVIKEYRPDAVISLGFAGGLATGQAPGDLVVAETLMSVESVSGRPGPMNASDSLASDEPLVQEALSILVAQGMRHWSGLCLTASQIVSRPEDKEALGQATGALAVEEESLWVGRVCREEGVPFLAVRAIVDTVGRRLPAYVAQIAFESSGASRWRTALPVLLRPWRVPELVRLGAAASQARKALTGFFMAWIHVSVQNRVRVR